jgi:A/G-specific adenine glycosylase
MDLGATICATRSPHCLLCPVRDGCAAARAGTQERYPIKSRRLVRGRRENVWLELRWRDAVWLVERGASGVWAGLWSFPEFDSIDALATATADWPGSGEVLDPFVHVLTHFDWHLQPVRWTFPSALPAAALQGLLVAWPAGRWWTTDAALSLGLPAPLSKRLRMEATAGA